MAISWLRAHPYDPNPYLNIHDEGWEKLSGRREETTSQSPS
jgi:galactonate dehydratase